MTLAFTNNNKRQTGICLSISKDKVIGLGDGTDRTGCLPTKEEPNKRFFFER